MEYYCLSDIGLAREKNQDYYAVLKNSYGDLLAIVADGIGGGKAGEVASEEDVKYFDFIFKDCGPFSDIEDIISFLSLHISCANHHVFDLSRKYFEYAGMGTTLTGIMITEKGIISLNCGDSRVYGFLDHDMYHLTEDHTLVNMLLKEGKITKEEAANHPKRHYLVKAIGVYETVHPDIHKVKDMDYFLVCSDGLHSFLSEEEIKEIVLDENMTVEDKTIALKDAALMKGGADNITIILLKR